MQIQKFTAAGLAAAGAIISGITYAQNGVNYNEVITTATRTPELLADTLASVTVITAAEIEKYQAKDIFELLSRVPGASFTRNGGKGSTTFLMLRGNQSDHTLFLIDGVRIGSVTAGSAALSALSTSLIERVEIIRGPRSALYGADAIGGVVNIITRASDKPKELIVETGFGSNKTTETTVLGGLNGEDFGLTVVANVFHADGIDHTASKEGVAGDKDAHRNNSLAVNFHQRITERLSYRVSYNHNDSESEYDVDCTDATTFAAVDCLIYTQNQVKSLAGRLDYQVSDNFSTSFQMGRSWDDSENLADNMDLSSTFNGGEFNTTKTEATWTNNLTIAEGQLLTLGLDYQLDEVDSSLNYAEDSRDNRAAFVQLQSTYGTIDTLFGARYDDNEQFGDHTTYSALAGYRFSDALRLVLSYGEGFKAPTFNDLYYPAFGDPTFEPEESKNYEIGLKGDFANASFYLAAYRNKLKNLIQANPVTFITDQTAEAEITGLEFNFDTELVGWALGFSASLSNPKNEVNDKLLPRRAKRSVSFDADRSWDRFSFGMSVRAESERYDDVANLKSLGGYGIVDVRVQYRINEQWKIKAKIDNLFDREYATAIDFSLGAYRAVGREAFISVVYTPFIGKSL